MGRRKARVGLFPLQAATTSLGLCVGFRGSIWPDRVKMAALPATLLEKVGSQFLSSRQHPLLTALRSDFSAEKSAHRAATACGACPPPTSKPTQKLRLAPRSTMTLVVTSACPACLSTRSTASRHVHRERVDLVGPVEGDEADLAVGLIEHDVVAPRSGRRHHVDVEQHDQRHALDLHTAAKTAGALGPPG